MVDGTAISKLLAECQISHIVWIPDSHLGTWEASLAAARLPRLLRVSREGEAIGLAAGLLLGGAQPLVVMQCTGFFEAGDAFRNAVHDLQLPLQMIVGVRGYRAWQQGIGRDNCAVFAEPVARAWQVPVRWFDPEISSPDDLAVCLWTWQREATPGILLWAE